MRNLCQLNHSTGNSFLLPQILDFIMRLHSGQNSLGRENMAALKVVSVRFGRERDSASSSFFSREIHASLDHHRKESFALTS